MRDARRWWAWLPLVLVLTTGCTPAEEESSPTPPPTGTPNPTPTEPPTEPPTATANPTPPRDDDRDGYPAYVDCDDQDALVHPGATEVCDSQDNNCDELVDDTQCVWRVDASSKGQPQDGLSWKSAFASLDAATARARIGDQLWVADGTYYPFAAEQPVLTLPAGVEVYGGFAGEEASLEDRPWPLRKSVLRGDVDRSGGLSEGDSLHVVVGADNALLNGFTVEGGKAADSEGPEGCGGGMLNADVEHLVLANLTFARNEARAGGGLCNLASSVLMESVVFDHNRALEEGGGVYSLKSPVELLEASWTQNEASRGGGMYCLESVASLSGSRFVSNVASLEGGGLVSEGSAVSLLEVTFVGNSSQGNGGGMLSRDASPQVSGGGFRGNTASTGGGIYHTGGSLRVESSTLADNEARQDGGGLYASSATVSLLNVTLYGNGASDMGGGIYSLATALRLDLSTLAENRSSQGGGVYGLGSPITLWNSVVWGLEDGDTSLLEVESDGVLVVGWSCLAGWYAGTGNVTLGAVGDYPFVVLDRDGDAFSEYYLKHSGLNGVTTSSGCVDAGQDEAATSSGLDWQGLSTRSDGGLDSSPVDMGRHY